ncbi:prepilin-type N-terminal cleavage/methylation domain-containing protein [bacterium]|nr:prepilin-type N-terminal cleavage/methylation domain-containing protein [bacterium]
MRATHNTADPGAAAGRSGAKARVFDRIRRLLRLGSNRAGSTIVEVLISVIIIGIVIVPVFDGLLGGRMMAARRGEERMALRLIERKIEQLLDAGYGSTGDDSDIASVNVSSGTHPTNPSIVLNTRGNSDVSDDVLGSMTWTVQDIDWTSPGDRVYAKNVTVQLEWPSGAPRNSVAVTFMIGR